CAKSSAAIGAARLDSARLGPRQLAHCGDQVFELERLHERLHRAGLARDLEHVVISQWLVAGHGDDLRPGKLTAQLVDRLDALLFRHEDVGDDHVGRPRPLQRQSLNAVRGAFGFDAAALKPPQRKLPEVVAVVDDENARHVPGERKAECGFYAKRRGQSTALALLRQHQRKYRGWTRGLLLSVERERVPGDAVPGDAVPGDAVPGGAVPDDAVPGDAVPGDAVPGEVIPGGAIPDQG